MLGENTIISKIAKGEYPEKEVETKYGKFTIKFPSGRDFQKIAVKKAAMFGGMPMESFDIVFARVAERDSALSIIITKYPKDLPIEFQGDDIIDFPDEEVKNSLFKEFNIFYKTTQDKISGKSTK